jgi:hypothetical protein
MTKSRVIVRGHEGKARIKENVSGTLAANDYRYTVTSVSSAGVQDIITLAADQSIVTTATGAVQVAWAAVTDAREYKVYRKLGLVASDVASYNGSLLATIPGCQTYFIDDGTLSATTGSQGAGTSTPTVYLAVNQPQTRFNTSITEFAFEEISIDTDEGYNAYAHAGERTKTIKEGVIEVKGSIKRYKTDNRWFGAVAGSDKIGTTNTTIAYVNQIDGQGTGYFDGTSYTSSTGYTSPIPRTKPKYTLEITNAKTEAVPMVLTIDNCYLTDYKVSGIAANGDLTETISFQGEMVRAQYAGAHSFS